MHKDSYFFYSCCLIYCEYLVLLTVRRSHCQENTSVFHFYMAEKVHVYSFDPEFLRKCFG